MAERLNSLSEVVGFDESEGCLCIRLKTGTVPVVDENGERVIVSDPSIRQLLFSRPANEIPMSSMRQDIWNPWRQGP